MISEVGFKTPWIFIININRLKSLVTPLSLEVAEKLISFSAGLPLPFLCPLSISPPVFQQRCPPSFVTRLCSDRTVAISPSDWQDLAGGGTHSCWRFCTSLHRAVTQACIPNTDAKTRGLSGTHARTPHCKTWKFNDCKPELEPDLFAYVISIFTCNFWKKCRTRTYSCKMRGRKTFQRHLRL